MPEQSTLPDLLQCADEPIQVPGSIQSHGVLIASNEADLQIVQVSENVNSILGMSHEQLLGKSLEFLTGELQLRQLMRVLEHNSREAPQSLNIQVQTREGVRDFESTVHCSEGLLILELIPSEIELKTNANEFFRNAYEALSQVQRCSNSKDLLQTAADLVRSITCFDRVMVYIFDHEFNGNVVAESRNISSDSYLLKRFPASDIPAQARTLYTKNRFRYLIDTDCPTAAIIPAANPLTNKPTDLSYSILRSMSPIHIEYLKNMGVRASMSVSLVRNGALLGLIACHNSQPLKVSYQQIVACDLLAQLVSSQMTVFSDRDNYNALVKLQEARKNLLNNLANSDDFSSAFAASPFSLDVTQARGAAYVSGEMITLTGSVPTQAEVAELLGWLKSTTAELVFSTDSLSKFFPQADKYRTVASGLLALRLSSLGDRWMLWFRPEQIEEIEWAGNPEKTTELDSNMRIHPRKSFKDWIQCVTGRSLPWSTVEIESAMELRTALLDMTLTLADKHRAAELQVKVDELEQLNAKLESVTAQLRRTRDEAIEASRRKSEMVSIVSHDVRSPLTAIHGSLSLLSSSSFNLSETEKNELVELAQGSSAFLLSLINSLLDLETIESGSIELSITDVPLESLFKKTIEIVRANAEKKNVRLNYRPTGCLGRVDEDKMIQILVNLVSNAIKYSPENEQVEMYAEEISEELLICVKDQGRGVPAEMRQAIFERFKQVEAADRTEKGGTGLGLAICKALIEAQGGSIGVDSEPGKGSIFWLRLPCPQIAAR